MVPYLFSNNLVSDYFLLDGVVFSINVFLKETFYQIICDRVTSSGTLTSHGGNFQGQCFAPNTEFMFGFS